MESRPGGEIAGRHVAIRKVEDRDLARLRALAAEPAVAVRWGPVPDDELAGMLAITFDGRVIGAIQYEEEETPMYRHAGIDVFLGTAWHGRGLGTDAVRTLATWVVDVRGHHRVTIDPAADNAAAVRCYEKAGFRPVGRMRDYERDPTTGTWHDGLLMDLLAGELDRPGRRPGRPG